MKFDKVRVSGRAVVLMPRFLSAASSFSLPAMPFNALTMVLRRCWNAVWINLNKKASLMEGDCPLQFKGAVPFKGTVPFKGDVPFIIKRKKQESTLGVGLKQVFLILKNIFISA